ncbi:MAG: hypothetical protein DHS20C18_24290 [Saprospiraceae bacterium]|nr:MAG: hypothetical protein DHS20C18_24290 [Saprospiraceae bacterium]
MAEAMEKLIFQGIAKREAYAILRKGLDLLEEEPFWKALKGGAAIFMSKNHFSVKILPYWVEPEVYVDSEFVTGPISGSFR